jgi:dTDP-4-dehydrorhamnose 3,5-epimerase
MLSSKHFENRGSIHTIFDIRDFSQVDFVEDKVSKSFQGVIRGFHGDDKTWKLLTCIYGTIKFVTYNIDNGCKNTYILDGDSPESRSILVPPRTLNAHQCLSQFCIFHYKLSEHYTSPEDQWSVYFNDSEINPEWSTEYEDIISHRDLNAQSLKELKNNVL